MGLDANPLPPAEADGELLEAPAYAYEDPPAMRLWVSFFEPPSGTPGGRETVEVSWRDTPSTDELLSVLHAITEQPQPQP